MTCNRYIILCHIMWQFVTVMCVFFKSKIYYMGYSGRSWYLQYSYLNSKRKERKKKEKVDNAILCWIEWNKWAYYQVMALWKKNASGLNLRKMMIFFNKSLLGF